MASGRSPSDAALRQLRWPIGLTRLGLIAERATRAFWPLLSVILATLAALMFGLHERLPLELLWSALVLVGLGGLAALGYGIWRFRWPTRHEALERLDRTLPGRPITAILDDQTIGAGDPASVAVWRTHVARMAARAAGARPVEPDLRVSSRDPYAFRYVALLAFLMALIFGSVFRIATVTDVAAGSAVAAAGPSWEGWIEPPAYTGKPSIYLADADADALSVPVGSLVTLRLYGQVGALTVDETVSARTTDIDSSADPDQSFTVAQNGHIAVSGTGGRKWTVTAIADLPPTIALAGEVERSVTGEMRLPFEATDDYGVVSGRVELALDLPSVDRSYGLAVAPEPREPISFDLPLPFTGDRRDVIETLTENLAEHPWAGLPVRVSLFAEDAAAQVGLSTPQTVTLPGRRFFDPLASAIVEQRRDLLWSRQNAPRVAQVLRAISHRPEGFFRSETAFLKLRVAIRRLEVNDSYAVLTTERRDEIADALWNIALTIEEGNLSDALERLRRAQDRLEQAIREGATDEEIQQLMDELRQAMNDYMRQLQQQGQEDGDLAQNQDMQEITGDQLNEMLNRLQDLMEQGRMDEAQALLDQLRQLMENMQMAQNQQGQQSPGQQALDGLADTLRQQQGLSDETFGELQDQFDDQGQPGDRGQRGQQGQSGRQSLPDGRSGQEGRDRGDGQGAGEGTGDGAGADPGRGLADRQQALRQQLQMQSDGLPLTGTEGGEAAREALDRAGRAMDDAEESLRKEDFAQALDNQSEALDALRDGMRELAQELAQQEGQQGEAFGQSENDNSRRDPLGREAGTNGRVGTDEQLLQGEDVYRRARELLDEIRKRSSQTDRPIIELDYLKRLLERF